MRLASLAGLANLLLVPALAADPRTEPPHHHRHAAAERAWYLSVHADGAVDAGGNDGLLALSADGRPFGDPLGPTPAEVGRVHGLRGMLPLADGTMLVIAAWKENTAILRYGPPADDGVRPFLDVFARTDDSNPLLVHPYALAAGPDGTIYASNQDSNTVTRYGAPGTPLAGRPLRPDGSADAARAEAGLVVPSRKSQPEARHRRGIAEVRGIAFGPDGKLYVADRGDGEVSRWDPATGVREATVASREDGLSTPIQILFSPDGASMFVSDNKENSVFRIALADGKVTRFIGPDAGLEAPSALAIDGRRLLVGSRKGRAILRFDLASGAPEAEPFAKGLPDDPEWLVRSAR